MENLILAILDHLHYAGLFVLLLMGGVGIPVPEDLVLLASGFLISAGALDTEAALAVIYLGMLISDFLLYSIGKRLGPLVVEQKRFKRFLTPARLDSIEQKFKKRGVLVILVGRHLAGLRVQIFLAAGIMKMSAARFVMADAVSALVTISIMVGLGYRGGESFEAVRTHLTRVEHLAVVLGVAALAAYLLYRYARSLRRKEN
jgi:membrane protein DedA with SNARE-associated domain